MLRPLLTAALAVLAVSIPAAATGAPSVTLTGVVTNNSSISLKNEDGTNVTHLDPGSYTINVDDQSALHNFHLFGPGVDMNTPIETIGTATWNVTFTDGTYKFACDAHPTTMRGSFTAGTVAQPPAKLNGKVSARAISLTNAAGTRVRSLREGKYKVTVSDTSKTQNFHLTGPGVNRKTKLGTKSKATWTVNLTPGTYVYRSDKSKKLRKSFTVTTVPPPL